jgi:cell division protein FtsW (lipid II flippase)
MFRRIARALAFAYVLHLLFSHGGISLLIWLIVIGLLIHMFRRRRRRPDRYAY